MTIMQAWRRRKVCDSCERALAATVVHLGDAVFNVCPGCLP